MEDKPTKDIVTVTKKKEEMEKRIKELLKENNKLKKERCEVNKELSNSRVTLAVKEKRISMLMVENVTKDGMIEVLKKEANNDEDTTTDIDPEDMLNVQDGMKIKCNKCQYIAKTNDMMKKHTKRHHKDLGTVEDPRSAEKFTCGNCGLEVDSRTKLDAHIDRNHKEIHECDKCGVEVNCSDDLEEHIEVYHNEPFQQVASVRICRANKNGRCQRGRTCMFRHPQPHVQPQQSNSRSPNNKPSVNVPFCNEGKWCTFLAEGRCNYFHPGVGVQKPKIEKSSRKPYQISKEQEWKTCKFAARCDRRPFCPFKHYDQDFPRMKQHPMMMQQFQENY